MDLNKIKKLVEEHSVCAIDLKYCGIDGKRYHITFPVSRLEAAISDGVAFSGSSLPGMGSIESGDRIIKPDLNTVYVNKTESGNVIEVLGTICDAVTGVGFSKDPRSVANRAQEYMKSTGIADESFWIPELEFYVFEGAEIRNQKYDSGFRLSSGQGKDCLAEGDTDILNMGQQEREVYHINTPFDRYFNIRQQAVNEMEKRGINVKYHHPEVGIAGQQEIETEPSLFPKICDDVLIMKDIVRQSALDYECTATFMPKPIYNEAGSGLHFHIMLRKQGKNVFWKKGNYADLSDEALYFIGGVLKHAPSLTAFCNPSTNSFKRLLPGFYAPVKLFYGLANRCAAIRIPNYLHTEAVKRIEYRPGDATANPYLAMSAILIAGLDGIQNKINPTDNGFGPFDDNVFNWSKQKQDKLKSLPTNLEEALKALQKDNAYLLKNGVFTQELIDTWIELKMKEVNAIANRPHPYEMNLYYNL
ncbi:MAG: type I glutamate--ammonia ligase [Candidatus Cloacimonetes bacterium]|nr:type I glutamate--ammonia ligase [Candidatus Cloacimonadota bacterium]